MTTSISMNVEAALYNEHTLAWEPFIEPIMNDVGTHLSPVNLIVSITPVSCMSSRLEFFF